MATLVDSLIIALELDPSNFTKGQKEAVEAANKGQRELEKAAKTQERAGKMMQESFSKATREVLTFFTAVLGARGVTEFVSKITTLDAALGRLGRNVAVVPQQIAAWANAAQRMGGTADATAATIERMAKALYDFHTNGQMLPREYSQLQALTGMRVDTEHGVDKFLQDTAAALKALSAIDPSKAHFIAQGMGIDDATANVMIKYGSAVGAYLDQIKKLSPTDDAIKAAQDLQDKWAALQQTAQSLGNTILTTLGPQISTLLTQMTAWIDKNHEWIATRFVEVVGDLAKAISDIPWDSIKNGLTTFVNLANLAAEAVGGWTNAIEILFGLWVGSKFLAVLANATKLLGVFKATSAAAGAAGGAGAAGAAAAGAGGAGLLGKLLKGAGVVGLAATGMSVLGAVDPKGNLGGATSGIDDWFKRHLGIDPSNFSFSDIWKSDKKDGSKDDDVSVDGRPVSKANPLPVEINKEDGQGGGGGGGGWLSTLGGWISKFGIGGAQAATLPGGGQSGPRLPGIGGAQAATLPGGGQSGPRLPGNRGESGWWTPERQAHAYQRLVQEAGLSDAGARALVSRWKNVEAPGGPTSVNPKSGAFGIAQWLGSRLTGIKGNTDFDSQLTHAIKELSGSEKTAGDILRRAQSDMEGARGASAYERAEGYNPVTKLDNFVQQTAAGMRNIITSVGQGLGIMSGAKGAATMSSVSNDNRVSTNNSAQMNVGTVNVNAPNASDAKGVGGGIVDALGRSLASFTANFGLR